MSQPPAHGPPTPSGVPSGGPSRPQGTSAWVWIGLLLLFVFAREDDGEDAGGSSAPADTGLGHRVRSNPELPGVGEPVEHRGLRLTVTDIETGHESLHGFVPIGEFVVVYVEVEPIQDAHTGFWRDEQNLYTYDGTRVQEHFDATWAHGGEDDMLIMLSPEQKHRTSIVFDVDDPAEVSHIGLSTQTNGGDEVNVDVTG